MSFLLSCDYLSKTFGDRRLFSGISISFDDTERVGLIGPNGAGKSTLLKVMAGLEPPDAGGITRRRSLRLGYLPQAESFSPGSTIQSAMQDALADEEHLDEHDRDTRIAILLHKIGFDEPEKPTDSLSGGWRKRLAVACQLVREPDLLLLDEPTNHLDLAGINWLEELLANATFAFILCSHDRYFLDRVTNRVVELNATYADGYLSINGSYSQFIEKRELYLEAQAGLQQTLQSKVKREIEWLRRGAKARTTKAKGRIDQAAQLMDDLAEVKGRNNQGKSAAIDFTASDRQTRKLLAAKKVSKSLGGRQLFRDLDLVLSPGTRLGLVGPNGSGKTTLIRLLTGEIQPDSGEIRRADALQVVVFDQARKQLNPSMTLRDAISPNGDTVYYRGGAMHVATWAKQFLFRTQQLDQLVGQLSGGEQARILIAQLMQTPADVLILDEPTNDLDIPSLEVLEESLSDFPGALVLVTHDRFMIDRLATDLLGLDGRGNAQVFADLSQYERARREGDRAANAPQAAVKASSPAAPPPAKIKKLSYMELRELEQFESKILAAETALHASQKSLEDPAVLGDHMRMRDACTAVDAAQKAVDALYRRWEDLEARRAAQEPARS